MPIPPHIFNLKWPKPKEKTIQERWQVLSRLSRHRTLLYAAFIGLLSGFAALFFKDLVQVCTNASEHLALYLHRFGPIALPVMIVFSASLGALAGWITERFCPEAGGSGIPQAKATLMGLQQMRPLRTFVVKIIAGCTAIFAGFSLGREGPTIHLGSSIAAGVSNTFKIPHRSRRTLIAAGAGAGLGAAFNAPLAGFFFVLEELKKEMSALTYGTALIASVAAVAVARVIEGQSPEFRLNEVPPFPLHSLPAVVLLSVICALAGVAFNKLLVGAVRTRSQRRLPRWLAGFVVGIIAGALLWFLPETTGIGFSVANGALHGSYDQAALGLIIILFVLRFALTVISYGVGTPGGIFGPLLVMGSFLGLIFSQVAGLHQSALYGTVAMVSILSASVRAPLTSVILILEMTGEYGLLFSLLIGAFTANLIAEMLHDEPVYEALLEVDLKNRGHQELVGGEFADIFVEPGSRLDGRMLRNISLSENVNIAAVEREERLIAARGHTVIRAGDHLTVVVGHGETIEPLEELSMAAKAP